MDIKLSLDKKYYIFYDSRKKMFVKTIQMFGNRRPQHATTSVIINNNYY